MDKLQLDIANVSLTKEGTFLGYAAVFGPPPDFYNTIMDYHSFDGLVTKFNEDGAKLPAVVVDHGGVPAVVGKLVGIMADEYGLLVKGVLYIDEDEDARKAYRTLRDSQCAMSFMAHSVPGAYHFDDNGVKWYEEFDSLAEVTLTLSPANTKAKILAVRHTVCRSVDELDEKDEHLRQTPVEPKQINDKQLLDLLKAAKEEGRQEALAEVKAKNAERQRKYREEKNKTLQDWLAEQSNKLNKITTKSNL